MRKITHIYSLTPEWLPEVAEKLEVKIIDGKKITFPKSIGDGSLYFTTISPGISVVYFDFTPSAPLKITRLSSENELYIFHYDLSEHVNLIKINNIDYEIGLYQKLDLGIIDNALESSFKPTVGERTVALRILVSKTMLHDFILKYSKQKKVTRPKKKSGQEIFFHYGNIDSNSTVLVQSMKNKSVDDLSFDSFLKGVSLKLLGNFFNKFYDVGDNQNNVSDLETEAINKTREYLLNNLYGPFPSVTFLASMAGMSESKYKILFKKCFNDTPNNFFIVEKMKLAKELLQSGEFHTITEVIYELSYSKLSYFATKYFEILKTKASDDFVKSHTK